MVYPKGREALQASIVGYVCLKWIVVLLNPRVVYFGYPSNCSDFKENQKMSLSCPRTSVFATKWSSIDLLMNIPCL